MSYTLVVFDLHTSADDDFLRHKALGNLLLEERPSNFVSGGDFLSLDSCSFYDKVKKSSMLEDKQASEKAHKYIFGPLQKWNKTRKRSARDKMTTYFLFGNHEFRAKRLKDIDPEGYASLVDYNQVMCPPEYWDHSYEYGDGVLVEDVFYTHVPLNALNRPMGDNPIARQAKTHLCYGHTHKFNVKTVPQIWSGNSVRMIMNAPALLPQNQKEHYCKQSTTGWCYGLIRMRCHGPDQIPSYDYISTQELINQYG